MISLAITLFLGFLSRIFENTVSKILHKNPKNKEIANEIFNYSMVDTIKFLIDLIKGNL